MRFVSSVSRNEVESTHDTLVPSDSESSNDSAMDEKFDLNVMCFNYMEQNLAIFDDDDRLARTIGCVGAMGAKMGCDGAWFGFAGTMRVAEPPPRALRWLATPQIFNFF